MSKDNEISKEEQEEERIRQWREERLKVAESEKQERIRKLQEDREKEAKNKKQEEKEKIVKQLPDANKIRQDKKDLIERRQKNNLKALKSITVFLLFPTLLYALYISIIATPLFESEAVFSVQKSSGSSQAMNGIVSAGLFNNSLQDAFMVREYLLSQELMEIMKREHNFFGSIDGASIFNTSSEVDAYLDKVSVSIDIQEGILRLYVRSLSAEEAQYFSSTLLRYAQSKVNSISQEIVKAQVRLLERDVSLKESKFLNARENLTEFQITTGYMNPRDAVLSAHGKINEIEREITLAEQDKAIILENNPRLNKSQAIKSLNTKVLVLKEQLSKIKSQLLEGDRSINKILSKFEYISIEVDIAKKRWESSLNSLEEGKVKAFEQRRYFYTIVEPSLPSLPAYPEKLKSVATFFLIMTALYWMICLFLKAIKNHGRIALS